METVDLNLPSGNLWAVSNEVGYYDSNIATILFKDNLPTKEDFEELLDNTWHKWDDTKKGLDFIAKNGNHLFLQAEGIVAKEEETTKNNLVKFQNNGFYWTSSVKYVNLYKDSTNETLKTLYDFHFTKDYAYINKENINNFKHSIRLVQKPSQSINQLYNNNNNIKNKLTKRAKIIFTSNSPFNEYKIGEIGWIDGYAKGGDGVPVVAVIKKNGELVYAYSSHFTVLINDFEM